MDENKLKSIVEAAIKPVLDQLSDQETGLTSISKRLDDPETGLKRLNERVDSNTAAVMELESTIKGYADSYKANDTNVRKAEKRLEILEEDAGINVPSELQFTPPSDL